MNGPSLPPRDCQRVLELIGSIFHHGNFKAETANERELETLLRKLGYLFETEDQLMQKLHQKKTTLPPDPDFDVWWSIHHPFDWWAKARNGEPLPASDRLHVWTICRLAWNAAKR